MWPAAGLRLFLPFTSEEGRAVPTGYPLPFNNDSDGHSRIPWALFDDMGRESGVIEWLWI